MVKDEEYYERSYVELEFHENYSISKTRKRLSFCKELEICEYYKTHKNYRETTKVFGLQDSTVRKICKAATKTNKGNSVVSKEVTISRETKKERKSLYLIP